ncbi:LacI family DNA-binding transcriptional regulator [Conexibacter stalactiti]|uniref:LacI family DNA-binding transcriptional regulator n=1 Tax=Conexibacter stalactiti TaxID=1940611 RepID=A0ABU4HXZ2_9ACTN|nr:LacI family DNA-binding transcriptional regulator [Conexibacter stalactiti]MDW5596929.1 LacI family DNA-binding transcriptional regulator [Conexibacter stalactiti]MEC5037571.1 LacI family DNA-binding transcriptional regulator [Conexibacter stalactiti]
MTGNDPNGGRQRGVTIIDIARAAGTSKTTVSRVLNGEAGVAPATRTHVTNVAARLGYRANTAARSLRTRSSALIGFLVPHLNEVFSQQAERLSNELRRHQVDLVISTSGWDPDAEVEIVERMASRGVDALVLSLTSDRNPDVARLLRTLDPALVLLDREVRGISADTVLTDQSGGVEGAVAHLVELGHERIGLISMTDVTRPGREVPAAWRRGGQRAGLAFGPELNVALPHFDAASGATAAGALLRAGATAVIACVPEAAIAGMLFDLRDRGISIPGDLSLVGYHEPILASAKEPRIAAITRDYGEMGAIAGRLAITRLANRELRPRVETVQTGFLPGSSTAPPRAGR